MTDGNQTYRGDHFGMYRNTESLCCVLGTNIVLQVTCASKTNKQTNSQKKRSDLWLPEAEGGWRVNWMKVVKRYKLPVIRLISTRDVTHNMININNTAVCYI